MARGCDALLGWACVACSSLSGWKEVNGHSEHMDCENGEGVVPRGEAAQTTNVYSAGLSDMDLVKDLVPLHARRQICTAFYCYQ